jgi:hypothetical protein
VLSSIRVVLVGVGKVLCFFLYGEYSIDEGVCVDLACDKSVALGVIDTSYSCPTDGRRSCHIEVS